ncbi:hypothetical protein HOLleu_29250 [Holothuria leucospilota]|uniref:Uncharacterized protein n=1 Tax=Holothuria leucospilota TaxID=206669 RepID=A0A9Q1BN86_HOLLE|nr:hypothetical protein HOLleu_29250 [Holothuria leucospilota]
MLLEYDCMRGMRKLQISHFQGGCPIPINFKVNTTDHKNKRNKTFLINVRKWYQGAA